MDSLSFPRTAAPTEISTRQNNLIAAAQRGEIAAFNNLVRAYQELAYRLAHFVLDDAGTATTATQNAFLRAHRLIRTCPRENFRVWFLKILIQQCRKSERAAWLTPHARAASFSSPLQMGLATIPFDDRVACVLHDIVGLSDDESARITGATILNVREKRSRARRQLRDVIKML